MDITSYLLGKQSGGGTPNLQEKEVTITRNTTTNITADEGYDGLSEVEVTTNISGGDDLSEYFNDTISYGTNKNPGWENLTKKFKSPITPTSANMSYAFSNFVGTGILPKVITTNSLTTMNYTYSGCSNVTTIDLSGYNTSNVETMSNLFNGCKKVTDLDLSNFDFTSCTNVQNLFANCDKLTNLTFGTNLGKGYSTSQSANYVLYTLYLAQSPLLTHDSLMSVINNLYDIATAGVAVQNLEIGATNLAKLSQAEIDIATNKGWTVS